MSVADIENKLSRLPLQKASGPDELPKWLLVDFCGVLAGPIASTANASLRKRNIPTLWKSADICHVPKISPPQVIESDLRPISLTPVLSKVMEDFVYKWLLQYVTPNINLSQFGALKGTSTWTRIL